jgi:hypothetical protein
MGGGSGAVASSAHAACARFRGTDPLITHQPRRSLAAALGAPDDSGRIPEARWIRAMTFEALVRNAEFASRVATTAVGALGLPRPKAVTIANASKNVEATRALLVEARDRAIQHSAATLIHTPAAPYPGFTAAGATPVLPDFVVVAPAESEAAPWLIVGDAKDYERVRSRIDDARMLKGYIQVAFGAESFAEWAEFPEGLAIHRFGVLAVPRNSFLQPTAVTEDLTDHREEVRMRLAEKRAEAELVAWSGDATEFVAHLEATFDPATCTTCSLFSFCRQELRTSSDPKDLLVEVGVPADVRPLLVGLVDGSGVAPSDAAPTSTVAQIGATLSGRAEATGQRRVDPIGLPGTVNVVLVKADSAALGVHGLAVQTVDAAGTSAWTEQVFLTPQSDATRRQVVGAVGKALETAMAAADALAHDTQPAVHLVVPDADTADVLASIADTLAGVEISRLRWEHDVAQGRQPLTFDGQPATIPVALTPEQRLGVSFLLEDDRARAFTLRSTIVNVRSTLAGLIVPGGPASNAGRLDYLVGWAETLAADPLDHRQFADLIEAQAETPGARLSNDASDAIFAALTGGRRAAADPAEYDRLVRVALGYRTATLDRARAILDRFAASTLRDAYRAIEGSAQAVWRRRWSLQAFDLIRFGLTTRYWRNTLVPVIEADGRCAAYLTAFTNPQWADEQARDAGNRELAGATVMSLSPLTVEIRSRRISAGDRVALLHVNGAAEVERSAVTFKVAGAHLAIKGLVTGTLSEVVDGAPAGHGRFVWSTNAPPTVSVGDELVLIQVDGGGSGLETKFRGGQINVPRPQPDQQMAPKSDCLPESYAQDPAGHQWCCKPHTVREAEISDLMAQRREAGELNPQAWPPVLDADAFDVTGAGDETADTVAAEAPAQPDGLTQDDLE